MLARCQTGTPLTSNQAHLPSLVLLRADSTVAPDCISNNTAPLSGCLNQLRVLLLEDREVLLGFPVPYTIAGEHQVHLLECAWICALASWLQAENGFWLEGPTLIRLRVERPDNDDRQNVHAAEDMQRAAVQTCKNRREQQNTPAVADAPADYAPCIAFGTDLQREDLSVS